jgi:hypothetical protein
MDRKALVKNLKNVFSKNEIRDKYSEVWLSHIDFGGLYHTEKSFVLNVVPKHEIDTTLTEVRHVLNFLRENAKEEEKQIWVVDIHKPGVDLYYVRNDMIIYAEAEQE